MLLIAFSQDCDISPNQLLSQIVYIHTQMVIVEGCPLIYYYDFSPPPLKIFEMKAWLRTQLSYLNFVAACDNFFNRENIPAYSNTVEPL